MIDKIFDETIEQEKKEFEKQLKKFGIIAESDEITKRLFKVNMDLLVILTKTGLIENTSENNAIIEEFHDEMYKLGIELGVHKGKKHIAELVKNDEITLEEINSYNPEDFSSTSYW